MQCPLGLCNAFAGAFNAVYVGSFVAASTGPQYVGFVGLAYAISNTLSSWAWGRISQRSGVGRRWAFVAATIIHVTFFSGLAAWAYVFTLDDPTAGIQPPTSARLAFFVSAAALYAVADAVWYTLIPAMLQTFYSTGNDAACANASIRFYTAAGFACSAGVASHFQGTYLPAQMLAMVVVLILASMSLLYLHVCVASVDARNERTELAGQQSSRRLPTDALIDAVSGDLPQVSQRKVGHASGPVHASPAELAPVTAVVVLPALKQHGDAAPPAQESRASSSSCLLKTPTETSILASNER